MPEHINVNICSRDWSPASWRTKPIKQAPPYPDITAVSKATTQLKRLPPIVHPHEIAHLKSLLKDVAQGKAFLLQGGDCAELFDYCEPTAIESKIKLLLQMSLVLIWGTDKPVVRIGRMAGQYAKPRSSPTEVVDGVEMPSFRGDILNGYAVDERDIDPARLVSAYNHSAATLNYVRASLASGIADLHRPLDWDLGHVKDAGLRARYTEAANSITDMLSFLHTIGADRLDKLDTVDLFTSHEGLLLEYEEPLTRLAETPTSSSDKQTLYYDTSAHFLWIGDRTRQVDHAHVEFFRGIANPIGVKVGPTTPPDDIITLLHILNPAREPGKVTLITRYGATKVRELLPAHIRAVANSEYADNVVIWQCDPMHGNTLSTGAGVKTRRFSDIFSELRETLAVHQEMGSYLGGMHLELTGDAVTECLGGGAGLDEDDLSTNYTSFCDPRLNERQALELAFLVAEHYRKSRKPVAAGKN
ncbi:Phospho-2-dehydro-3-deoxyheptonate aldolase [Ceratocystis platani]|uniref:Phospho-2-dehydro-3-deoxyheptonate aldolase n=1 Tax=Ceratocystis fimbriata f. sp. platani TaxID=88771 RepID=A0A0F8CWV7_CERFI|nr:Phospho-2-dehydro-3-deoxyheptonate aldolase [Ceratocystis platani]